MPERSVLRSDHMKPRAPESVYSQRAKPLERLRVFTRRAHSGDRAVLELEPRFLCRERFGHVEAVDTSLTDELGNWLLPTPHGVALPERHLASSLDGAGRIRPTRRPVIVGIDCEGLGVHRWHGRQA